MRLSPIPFKSPGSTKSNKQLRADDGLTLALVSHNGQSIFKLRINLRILKFAFIILSSCALLALVSVYQLPEKTKVAKQISTTATAEQRKVILLDQLKNRFAESSLIFKAAGELLHKQIWDSEIYPNKESSSLDFIGQISQNLTVLNKTLNFLSLREEAFQNMPVGMPLESAYITSLYGKRPNPFGFSSHFHTGVDFANVIGTPIKAAADGLVLNAGGDSSGYGLFVRILHKHGFVTLYAHCSRVLVSKGQQVKRGQVIARLGESGSATGPHLHYEVRLLKENNLNPVFISLNPWPFVKERL